MDVSFLGGGMDESTKLNFLAQRTKMAVSANRKLKLTVVFVLLTTYELLNITPQK